MKSAFVVILVLFIGGFRETVVDILLPEIVITPDYSVEEVDLMNWIVAHTQDREGFRPLPYRDPGDGKLVVGYGTKVTREQAREIRAKGGITRREADTLSAKHYARSVGYCRHYFGRMPFHQEVAVVSLMRGMGIGNLLNSELADYIRRRDVSAEAKEVWLRTAVRFGKQKRVCRNNLPSRQFEANLWVANADIHAGRYVWEVVTGKRAPTVYEVCGD